MKAYPVSLERLGEQFARLPGIGNKTARRLAFFVLGMSDEDAEAFASAILEARKTVHTCPVCQNLTDQETCPICADETRDGGIICVVADPKDVIAMEKAREYRGKYHVLHGVISPLGNVGPEDLKIRELLLRLQKGDVKEVIIATNPTIDGETTALFIAKVLDGVVPNVTRLGYGLPMGSSLDYADALTLSKAFEGRKKI